MGENAVIPAYISAAASEEFVGDGNRKALLHLNMRCETIGAPDTRLSLIEAKVLLSFLHR
jgi:hypothetical protein